MELVMPMNYEVLEQDEMMYLDGGLKITLSRSTINKAVRNVYGVATSAALGYLSKTKLAAKIASLAWGTAKGIFAAGGFGTFVATALTASLAGVLVASAGVVATVYITNKTLTINL